MRVKVMRGCMINGEACSPGARLTLPADLARHLIGTGQVVEVSEKQPAKKKAEASD